MLAVGCVGCVCVGVDGAVDSGGVARQIGASAKWSNRLAAFLVGVEWKPGATAFAGLERQQHPVRCSPGERD